LLGPDLLSLKKKKKEPPPRDGAAGRPPLGLVRLPVVRSQLRPPASAETLVPPLLPRVQAPARFERPRPFPLPTRRRPGQLDGHTAINGGPASKRCPWLLNCPTSRGPCRRAVEAVGSRRCLRRWAVLDQSGAERVDACPSCGGGSGRCPARRRTPVLGGARPAPTPPPTTRVDPDRAAARQGSFPDRVMISRLGPSWTEPTPRRRGPALGPPTSRQKTLRSSASYVFAPTSPPAEGRETPFPFRQLLFPGELRAPAPPPHS